MTCQGSSFSALTRKTFACIRYEKDREQAIYARQRKDETSSLSGKAEEEGVGRSA
jgi:hypothetical protein